MKANTKKELLNVLGIILCITLGVNILYFPITKWDTERALRIGQKTTETVHGKRGNIIDSNGAILAYEDSTYTVYLDCLAYLDATHDLSAWHWYVSELAESLAGMFPQRDTAGWYQYVSDGYESRERCLPIAQKLSKEDAETVRQFPLFRSSPSYGGGHIEVRYLRKNPYGQIGLNTIGTIYADTIKTGLEKGFDTILSGSDGTEIVRTGEYEGQVIQDVDCIVKAQNGMDIHTTLAVRLQTVSDSLLRCVMESNNHIESGCFLLMDVRTGALRAMVNLSRTEKGIEEVRNDAIRRCVEPGSLAQVMTYAALLSDGKIRSLRDMISTNHGVLLNNHISDAHIIDYERRNNADSIAVRDGFALSSIYVPAFLVQKHYNNSPELFIEKLQTYCPVFDFDLPGLASNRIIMPNSVAWTDKSLSYLAYGYGLLMTPISLLSFYNCLANNGIMMKPYLVENATDEHGECINYGPVVMGQVMPKDVALELLRGLNYVTENGLTKRIKNWVPGVIGKTGTTRIDTSKIDENQYASTFVGFIPANGSDEPEYSVMCVTFSKVTNKPFYGNDVPACVVRDFVNEIM